MIHIVIGTRAQLFKMAPVMMECQRRKLKWRWIYTAQHRETIQETLDTFGLPGPDYTVIDWQSEAKTMAKMWAWIIRMTTALMRGRKILSGHTGKTSIVVTHGDTLTTLWAALLGKFYRCKVMHVEAGMRSHQLFEPFPEEICRIITGWLTNYHVCPDAVSVHNLRHYPGKKFNFELNTFADTIMYGLKHCESANLKLPKGKYAVASTHRYENIFKKERFEHVIHLLEMVAQKFPIYMPQHPATKEQLDKMPELRKRIEDNSRMHLLPRLEYLPFTKLIKHAEFVMTDGGGNQEELYFMGKPTLLMRFTTERPDHLGKTTVLSKLKESVVMRFVEHYKKYQKKPIVVKKSPSSMTVDILEKFANK